MPDIQKKILVLEDEPDVLKVVVLRLEKAGYKVITAPNGEEGLKLVYAQCPDLVVSDVLMPVMDGFAFYKNLKSNPVTSDIPVLILTARGQMEDSFRVLGADDFLTKPFEPEELLLKIEALLRSTKIKKHITKKVLVSGSDKKVIESVSFQLKKIGCQIDSAKDGAEIITKIVQFAPDILLMEVPLYGMGAGEVVKILRQMEQFKKRPILIYSFFRAEELGSSDVRQKAMMIDDAKEEALQEGATANLGRFNEFSFLETVQKYLEAA